MSIGRGWFDGVAAVLTLGGVGVGDGPDAGVEGKVEEPW